MIHNLLIIKNGVIIHNYKAGPKNLDTETLTGLLEAIFGMGHIFFQKKINKVLFTELKTIFRALSKNIFIGIVEDIDSDNEVAEQLVKKLSKGLHQIILILERTISPLIVQQIPWIKEELKYALEKALLKIPCAFLRRKRFFRIRGYSCTFVEKSLGRSPVCNLYESKNCPYLQDEQLCQTYRTPFKLNDGVPVDELVKKLGRWKKTEKYLLHVLNSNNGITAMELKLKLKAYEIDVSPKKALDLMSKLEEKGFVARGPPPIYEHH